MWGGFRVLQLTRSRSKSRDLEAGVVSIRAFIRFLRKTSAPFRNWVRLQLSSRPIQRTSALAREDRYTKRRRWHVLVDLINENLPAHPVVVEVGVGLGKTTVHVHKYCPQVQRIYAVDINEPPELSFLKNLEGVHFIKSLSIDAADLFEDESVDLVFIDADHSEEAVWEDMRAWMPKLKSGGVMSGHDYDSHNHPGVRVAVDRYFAGHSHPVHLEANKVWWTLKTSSRSSRRSRPG